MEINKAFIKELGFDDFREFFIELGDWYYTSNFTYRDFETEQIKAGMKRFVFEHVYGEGKPEKNDPEYAKVKKIIKKFITKTK